MQDISLEKGQTLIRESISLLPLEILPVSEAFNRVLGQDLTAAGDLPPYSQSAVDGFALADGTALVNSRFTIKGYLQQGDYPTWTL
ncbi:MAG: hypothetical protein ABFD08_11315, partial [Syntrophomonas sp.]